MWDFIRGLVTFGMSMVVSSVYLWVAYEMYFHQFIEQQLEYKFFLAFSIILTGFLYKANKLEKEYSTAEILNKIFEHALIRAIILAILWCVLEVM